MHVADALHLKWAEMVSPPRKRGSIWSVARTDDSPGFPPPLSRGQALRGNDGDTAPYTHAISFGDALDELGRATLEKREPVRIVDLDLSFHDNICRLADHGRLYAAWHSASTQARVLAGPTSKTHYNHPEEPKELHLVILEAMRAGDLARATEYLTNHILDAQERAVRALAMLRQDGAE